MLAVFHVPLTDLRPFLDEPAGRVTSPVWPMVLLPDELYRRPFVRGFGMARQRPRGGSHDWAGEDFYCDLSGAVRLVGPVLKSLTGHPGLKRYSAFRRLFWDGQFKSQGSVVGRGEFGFGLNPLAGTDPCSAQGMADIVDGLLRQPVRIVQPGGADKPYMLSHCGSALAAAYLHASSQTNFLALSTPHAWWITAGTPLMVVEGRQGVEVDAWPAPARALNELTMLPAAGLRVFFGKRTVNGRDRPVWYFEVESDGFHNRDVLRRLRLNVTRLHSALAALRVLADLQTRGKLAPQTPQTQQRLAASLGQYMPFLYKEHSHGLALPPFVAAALTMAEALTPAMFASLRALIPAPGRGLANQLDMAAERLPGLQPAPDAPLVWDIFIAHAGPDLPAALSLFDAIGERAHVFLDQKCLLLGDDWDLELGRAQHLSRMTVVLVGAGSDNAYYLRSEISAAISLARLDKTRHRVIPVYLSGAAGRNAAQPYGLNLKHGVELGATPNWLQLADQLVETLVRTRSTESADT